jgi:hypothetical protein
VSPGVRAYVASADSDKSSITLHPPSRRQQFATTKTYPSTTLRPCLLDPVGCSVQLLSHLTLHPMNLLDLLTQPRKLMHSRSCLVSSAMIHAMEELLIHSDALLDHVNSAWPLLNGWKKWTGLCCNTGSRRPPVAGSLRVLLTFLSNQLHPWQSSLTIARTV